MSWYRVKNRLWKLQKVIMADKKVGVRLIWILIHPEMHNTSIHEFKIVTSQSYETIFAYLLINLFVYLFIYLFTLYINT